MDAMGDDTRQHPRAKVPGVDARFEAVSGAPVEAPVRDISCSGVFIATTQLVPPGKLVHLEIRLPNDREPIGAVGRVIWCREQGAGENRPAGMGLRYIDMDEGALEVIRRLVEKRPRGERTVIGVQAAPAPQDALPREPTVQATKTPTRRLEVVYEADVPVGELEVARPAPPRADIPGGERGRGRAVFLWTFLVALIGVGVAAYVLRDRWLP